jgi:peptide/nickel transport system substrate-binding protein
VSKRISRRGFVVSLVLAGLMLAATVLAACQPAAPVLVEKVVVETVVVEGTPQVVEKVVKETVVVEKEVVKEVEVEKAIGLKQVPRERTYVMSFHGFAGAWADAGVCNPYAIGYHYQYGLNSALEPLEYYSAFADEYTPWLATGHEYNDDFTELTVHIREGAEWSDGEPFTAEDVAYTMNMLIDYAPALRYSAQVNEWVNEVEAVDDYTVKITFNSPKPRFWDDLMVYKYDEGIHWVPEHIFKDVEDVTTFAFCDPEKGWPVVTGMYEPVSFTHTQLVMDRRDDWWAAKTGFAELPEVERIIGLPEGGNDKLVHLLINNQLDTSRDLPPGEILAIWDQNPAVVTHTPDVPYGYISYWTIVIGFNDMEEPWSNPDIRWAISYAIDRQQAIDVAYGGAGLATKLPMPDYPGLRPYADSIADILEEYDTNEFNLEKSAALMEKNGYVKDSEGFWSKDGERLTFELGGALELFGDIGPVVAEQLRRAGFDTEYINPPDHWARIGTGEPTSYVFFVGNPGSVGGDPFATMLLYHELLAQPTGEQGWPNVWRWQNEEYSAIVDEMSALPLGHPDTVDLYREAMEIWLPDLPSVPFIQWIHRMPMNTTYWTGWPTEDDPYVNGAVWQLTHPMTLRRLEAVQPDPREQ